MESFKLNKRTPKDVADQIKTLSKAYTPEWDFQAEQPDAGSVIGLIFANQMARNISCFHSSFIRHQRNLVNLLSLTLTPATPSTGIVTMDLAANTIDGARVLPGTRLICQNGDGEEEGLVFETQEEVFVTESKLTHILGISGIRGKIIPYKGEIHIPEAFGNPVKPQSFHQTEFQLFDFQDPGVSKSCILLYHKSFLHMKQVRLYLRFKGNNGGGTWEQIFGNLEKFRFCRLGEQGAVPIKNVAWEQDMACLDLEGTPGLAGYGGEEYGLLSIEALTQPQEEITLESLLFSSSGESREPEFLCHGSKELGGSDICPFGQNIELYDEFYIGSDFIFSQKEAGIQLEFDLSFREELVSYGLTEEIELKPIKRVPRNIIKYQQYETCADEVSIEYFNGMGWKPVNELLAYQNLFNGNQNGHMALSFSCPLQWKELEIGAYYGRVLRFQVHRAPNCYMTPCLHRIPVLNQIRLSYSYEGVWRMPERVRVIQGTRITDVTKQLLAQKPVLVSSPLPYEGEGLYLGFDKSFSQGPVSLFFQL